MNEIDELDQATAIGLDLYRALYPEGALDPAVEEQASLSVTPGKHAHRMSIHYWLCGQKEPFLFFQAEVDRATSQARVIVAEPASSVPLSALAPEDEQGR